MSEQSVPAPFSFEASGEFRKGFKALKKKYPSLPADLAGLRSTLETAPQSGTPLGKDCYKIRLAIKSKNAGKSGDARVITCVKIIQTRIYLFAIYDKSEQDTIDDRELERLLKEISD